MSRYENYYELLGLSGMAPHSALLERIAQERVRVEILKHIPARRAEAERLSAELEAAAAVLLDPEGRKRYDESLPKGNSAANLSENKGTAVDTEGDQDSACSATSMAISSTPDESSMPAESTSGASSASGVSAILRDLAQPRSGEFEAAATAAAKQKVPSNAAAPVVAGLTVGGERPREESSPQTKARLGDSSQSDPGSLKRRKSDSHVVTAVAPVGKGGETGKLAPARSLSKALLGLLAGVAVTLAIVYILGLRKQLPQADANPTPTPLGSVPATPTPQVQPGQVIDLRPPQVSLLNPPIVGPSPASARDPRMAQGEIGLLQGADGVSIIYPGGKPYLIDRRLYSPSSAGEGHYVAGYGTWVIQTNAQLAGPSSEQMKVQLSALADINGDGWPEIVFEDYSGGAHCCTSLLVLSLRLDGPAVVFGGSLGSGGASMQDLDGDGRKEILTERLFEYALGSFADGTFELPVAYSAGSDGVYRVNTRAFKNWLETGYEQERTNLAQAQGDAEQRDTGLINLFFLAYLTGQTNDAYSYLAQLQQIPGREHPLLTLRSSLNDVAPEVAQEPAFQLAIAKSRSETPNPQPSPEAAQRKPEETAPSAEPAKTPLDSPDKKSAVTASPSPLQVAPASAPTPSAPVASAPSAPLTGTPSTYAGPLTGFIVWKGVVEKRGEITFDGSHASIGSADGELPGVRVVLNLDTKNYALVEHPSENSGWKHFKIRSRDRREAIIIPWQVVK